MTRKERVEAESAAVLASREKRAQMMLRAYEAVKAGETRPATLEEVQQHNDLIQKLDQVIVGDTEEGA